MAVAIGLTSVFISPNFWFVPLLAMLAYAVAGYSRSVNTGTVFEFGDSLYYLGFTLSIGALLASLEPFKGSGLPDPGVVFRRFGIGMLTTLAGVVGRTLLQTFHRVASETIEEVNRRVTAESRHYVEQLSVMNQRMVETVEQTAQTYERTLAPGLVALSEALDSITRDLTGAVDAATTLNARASQASQAFDSLAAGYTSSSRKVVAAQDEVVSSSAGYVRALAGAASATGESMRPATLELARLTECTVAARVALDELERRASAIQIDPAPLAGPIATVGKALEHVAGSAREQARALATSIGLFSSQMEQMRDAGTKLADPKLAHELDRFTNEVSLLADSTKLQRDVTSDEVQALRTQTEGVLQSSRDVAAALDEITRVALEQLKALDPTSPREGMPS